MSLALVTMSHIDTGLFGLIGFPAIGISYAVIRMGQRRTGAGSRSEVEWLRRRVVDLEQELRGGAGPGPTG